MDKYNGFPYRANIATAAASGSKHFFNKRTSEGAQKLMNYMKQFTPKQPTIPGVGEVSTVGSGTVSVENIEEILN